MLETLWRRMLGLALAGGSAFGLAGCDTGEIITRVGHSILYERMQVVNAIRGGFFPVIIQGSPVAEADGALPEDIATRLALPNRYDQVPFQAITPGQWGGSGSVMILAYNPTGTLSADAACQDPGSLGGAPAPATSGVKTTFSVFAVFCVGRDWAARGHMQLQDIDGLDDPKFARSMTNLFNVMLPNKLSERKGN